MIKIGLVVSILIVSLFPVSAQESKKPFIYQIKAVHANADLDEKTIAKYKKRAIEWGDPREALRLFKPVKGKFKVILFVATDYGLSAIDDKEHI